MNGGGRGGGGGGGGSAVLHFGLNQAGTNPSMRAFGGGSEVPLTLYDIVVIAPCDCTIVGMSVKGSAPGGVDTLRFMVQVNSVDTTLFKSFGPTPVSYSGSQAGSVSVLKGQLINVHVYQDAGGPSTGDAICDLSVIFTGGGVLSSPLTTKGDIWGYSTVNARQAVGADDTILTADSSKANGIDWKTNTAYKAGDSALTPTTDGVQILGTIAKQLLKVRSYSFDSLFAPTDTNPSARLDAGQMYLGASSADNLSFHLDAQGSGVAKVMTGSKIQQDDAPTTGKDLCNKTYVDGAVAPAPDIGCKVGNTTDFPLTNTPTALTWTSESYDTDTMHDNAVNNTRITIKTAGKYLIGTALYITQTGGAYRLVQIIKNGVTPVAVFDTVEPGAGGGTSLTCEMDCAVNDYFEVFASNNGVAPNSYTALTALGVAGPIPAFVARKVA